MPKPQETAIAAQGELKTEPREVYGTGPTILRLGNGGAGATGLLRALSISFLSTLENSYSISWTHNHSRSTQLALFHNHIDIALTYERGPERVAESEGWSKTAGCAFHDHFVLAGPLEDPAGVFALATSSSKQEADDEEGESGDGGAVKITEAFKKIARSKARFVSRCDGSTTMERERSLWRLCGLEPWKENAEESQEWYRAYTETPSEALMRADREGAYLLTDRSTLLTQVARGTVRNTTVFVEPGDADDSLMNSCYALYSPSVDEDWDSVERGQEVRRGDFAESKEKTGYRSAFLHYLFSPAGQKVIADFGTKEVGVPFFAPVADGFARTSTVGGRPEAGGWICR
ncbi:MAG: hypothetical protein M1831_001587 [Alyxoria varia]|nr:MAG: hypothetical protein M1831_001587 [Alyxoria varia]